MTFEKLPDCVRLDLVEAEYVPTDVGSPEEWFERWLALHGIIGYDTMILHAVRKLGIGGES